MDFQGMRVAQRTQYLASFGIFLMMVGCGPQSFQSASAITVMGGEKPPEPEKPVVEVTEDQIVIHQKIQFEFDKAEVRPESFNLLNQVAETIKANPDIKQVRVEGYASDEGSAQHNMELSSKRAASVKSLLVEYGVEASRLSSKGYGETRPLVPGNSDEARIKNRRVEFHISRRD